MSTLSLVLTAIVGHAAPPPDLSTRAGSDWPCFLGPTQDGKSTDTGKFHRWETEGPPVLWSTPLGTGYAPPVVSRGRLFHFDRFGDQARLTCRHAETGVELWQFNYPTDYEDRYGYNNGPRCCPVVDEDRVYIFGAEGMLHALTVEKGELLWKVDTTARFHVPQNFFGVGSTPCIEGNLLIAQIGGADPNAPDISSGRLQGKDSGIVAFDKLTGEVKYQITDELASYSSPVTTTIGDRRWGFVFARGGLVAFEPKAGTVDFHFPWRASITESVNAANPVIFGNQVFISETYGPGSALLEVKSGGYDVVWQDDRRTRSFAMQAHWNTPILVDRHLYGCSGRHTSNAELRCVEWSTGKVKWSQPLPRLGRSSLTFVASHFLCQGEEGPLLLLKVNSERFESVAGCLPAGKAIGGVRPPLQYPCWAAPVVARGLMYVRGDDQLICMELFESEQVK